MSPNRGPLERVAPVFTKVLDGTLPVRQNSQDD